VIKPASGPDKLGGHVSGLERPNRWAQARSMPLAAPVTSARLPSSAGPVALLGVVTWQKPRR
jgi:hypothetical protein